MSYPKQTLDLQPTRGIVSDVAAAEVGPDYWTGGINVQFRDGFASRIGGTRDAYNDEITGIAPTDVFHLVNAPFASANWWLLAQKNGRVDAVQSGVTTRIDNNALVAVDHPWEYSSALINGIPILNNSKNEPRYWPGSGNLVKLPGWTDTETAKVIAVTKFHVFALNISGPGGTFPNLVKWSSATEPGTVPASWTPQPDNDAGSFELADTPGEILCAVQLEDSLFVYKRTATYQVRFVGGQNVFSQRKIQSASGALTPRSVCDIGGAHFIVSDGEILISDGTTRRNVGEARMRDFLFNQLDPDNFLNLFCIYNRGRDEVLIGFPSAGNTYCNMAIIYDVSRDCFGIRMFPDARHAAVGFISDAQPGNTWAERTETWASAVGSWASGLASNAKDSLSLVKQTAITQEDTNNLTVVDANISKTGLTFGDPERVKFVKEVHIRTRDPYGELLVRVGGQMTPTGPTEWSAYELMTGNEQIVSLNTVGRYISVEVRSVNGQQWKLTGVQLVAELRGYY